MNNERGFTLLEVLFVLSITCMILLLGFSIQTHVLDEHQTKQFFNVFQSDVMLIQQRTMLYEENLSITIKPEKHQYEVRKGGTGKLLYLREIPESWEVRIRTLTQPMSFTSNGTIRHPGTLNIKTKTNNYNVIFPFGKGRGYIVEQ